MEWPLVKFARVIVRPVPEILFLDCMEGGNAKQL
jgi:hypothetical protein